MNTLQKIQDDILYVGSSDRRISLFENVYPVEGMTYNSYLIVDQDATILIDGADKAVRESFLENVESALGPRKLDYLVVQHMEGDHSACLKAVIEKYPDLTIVASQRAIDMLYAFFDLPVDIKKYPVKEGDFLKTANHNLQFISAAMVHWPEVMVTYDSSNGILFTADAFGTFGSKSANLYAHEQSFDMDEARRYYYNIVGKYGVQVQALLRKATNLDIKMLCPLHGPIWTKDISTYIELYNKWSSYQSEVNSVLILYGTIYGNTEKASLVLASELGKLGVEDVELYDVSKTDVSVLLAKAFSFKAIVFASSSYNGGLFLPMETLLRDLKAHNLQNKTYCLMENGSWAPSSGRCMVDILDSMKNMDMASPLLSIRSSLKDSQIDDIRNMAEALARSLV